MARRPYFAHQINEMGQKTSRRKKKIQKRQSFDSNLHTRMLTCIVVDFLLFLPVLMLCDNNCTTLTLQQQQQQSSPGAVTVTTATLSQLDKSAEQLQVATPPTSCSFQATSVQLTATSPVFVCRSGSQSSSTSKISAHATFRISTLCSQHKTSSPWIPLPRPSTSSTGS